MASRTLAESHCSEGVSHIITAAVDRPGESTFGNDAIAPQSSVSL